MSFNLLLLAHSLAMRDAEDATLGANPLGPSDDAGSLVLILPTYLCDRSATHSATALEIIKAYLKYLF